MATTYSTRYRKRRWVELFLLAFALGTVLLGLCELYWFGGDPLPSWWPTIFGGAAAALLVTHLVVRFRAPFADPILLPVATLLNGLGILMIHRLDLAGKAGTNEAKMQLIWTGVSLVCFLIVLAIRDLRFLSRFPYLLFIAGIVLLLLPMAPGIGVDIYGARIWIHLGPYSFQPGEIAKLVLAAAFAGYLAERKEVLALAGIRILGIDFPRARDLGPIAMMWVASILVLVVENDLGTSLMFFGLFVAMLYVATQRVGWPILGLLSFLGAATVAYFFAGHVKHRFDAWLHPFDDVDNQTQIISAQFGMDMGGISGTGWGMGRPWMTIFAKSDMIFSALGEELGMAGMMAIIVLFGILIARGMRTAMTAEDAFSKLLAMGLAFVVALQTFTIIGGVTRLIPLTGLTTPFMSQGGSALLSNWVLIGMLMAISHQARKPQAVMVHTPDDVSNLADDATQVIAL